MSDNETKTAPLAGGPSSNDGLGADACRAAFVAMVKDENFYREPGCKTSLKAHWTGAIGGFADEALQRRWKDFEKGWKARAEAPNAAMSGEPKASPLDGTVMPKPGQERR